MIRTVLGVLALNAGYMAVGGALLLRWLRGRSRRDIASFAPISLLAGCGAVALVTTFLAMAGTKAGSVTVGFVAAALAAIGVAFGVAGSASPAIPAVAATPSWLHRLVMVGTVAVVGLGAVTAMRSSPWLDDSWMMWLAKGRAIELLGLDARLFAPSSEYVVFPNQEYPLSWSILTNAAVDAAGSLDLRALNVQLSVIVVAFFGAAHRLLRELVTPLAASTVLALLALCPELHRQMQSGGVDLPVAAFTALFFLAGTIHLQRGEPLALVLAGVFLTISCSLKLEGLAIGGALVAVLAAAARSERRRVVQLVVASAVAGTTAIPWQLWQRANGVRSPLSVANALRPSFLVERADRIVPAAQTLRDHLLDVSEWFVVVPALTCACVVAAVLDRRVRYLVPVVVSAVLFAMFVWAYWADTYELDYRLSTSAYRVVDGIVFVAVLASAPAVDRLLRSLLAAMAPEVSAPASATPPG